MLGQAWGLGCNARTEYQSPGNVSNLWEKNGPLRNFGSTAVGGGGGDGLCTKSALYKFQVCNLSRCERYMKRVRGKGCSLLFLKSTVETLRRTNERVVVGVRMGFCADVWVCGEGKKGSKSMIVSLRKVSIVSCPPFHFPSDIPQCRVCPLRVSSGKKGDASQTL